jgi:FkbM family methyltransferase
LISFRSIFRAAKPEYLFRPSQILRRLRIEAAAKKSAPATVWLPWGYPIVVDPAEQIGWAIYSRSIYELPLTEALFRLAAPGDIVVDGGANIGYATSILAARVGPTGQVHCFEPNPQAFEKLSRNVAVWQERSQRRQFVLHREALGARPATATLHIPASSDWNGGRARIESSPIDEPGDRVTVPVVPLDSLFGQHQTIAVVKLDLEGFELEALQGMTSLLRQRRVKAIVFEEFRPYPAPTHQLLKDFGYSIFGLDYRVRGIACLAEKQPRCDPVYGPPPNYVATGDPAETIPQLEKGFWRSFGPAQFFDSRPRNSTNNGPRNGNTDPSQQAPSARI